jgi:hypothetical protein
VGAMVLSRQRKAEAQKVMAGLAPMIPASTTLVNEVRPGAAASAPARAPAPAPAARPPVRESEPPTPIRDRPVPVLSADDTGGMPAVKPVIPSAITNEGELGELPSPTQFLRRFDRATMAFDEGPPKDPILPPLPSLPPSGDLVPAAAAFPPEDDGTQPEMQSRPALWAIDDAKYLPPPDAPEKKPPPQQLTPVAPVGALRSARNARLESGAMMLKTQVLMPTEGTKSEAVAWLARLGSFPSTLPLSNGYKVGTWTFSVDTLGRWVAKNRDSMKVLSDGELLDIDGDTYVMKLATRVRPSPSSKDGLLLIVGGPDDGRVVSVARGEPKIVGAHPMADVRVRGKMIAPQHLGVSLEGGRLNVADLGTADGFKVGGEQAWRASLAPGQELQLGNIRLVFQRA